MDGIWHLGGEWYEGQIRYGGEAWRFQAKVYGEGSPFGIGNGRVSKLMITRQDADYGSAVYSYDRGLDYDRTPDGLLDAVLDLIDALAVAR